MKTKLLLALALSLASTTATHAVSLSITNADFSSGGDAIPGWTEVGQAAANYFQRITTGGPDANGYCSMRGRNSALAGAGINQTLTNTWLAGDYTFTFAGTRIGSAASLFFDAVLYAGAKSPTVTSTVSSNRVDVSSLTALDWVTNTINVNIPNGSPAIGQTIGIWFQPPNGGNQGGTTFVVGIDQVQIDFTPSATPDLVGYTINAATYAVGDTIATNYPSVTGGTPVGYSIDVAVPAGLSFNTNSGIITGSPSAVSAIATYNVTADFGGSVTDTNPITIEILEPYLTRYTPSNINATVGIAIAGANPTLFGQTTPTNYTVAPALPAGLSLNPTNGNISGTPLVSGTNTYIITADYAAFTDSTAPVTFRIANPRLMGYADTDFILAVGKEMRPAPLTISGSTPTNFIVTPALPAGVSLNPTNGTLSGTATVAVTNTDYAITGQYNGFSDSSVTIALRVVAGFADDFNNATGNANSDTNWTMVMQGNSSTPFGFNGSTVPSSPTGSTNGFFGPTMTYDNVSYPGTGDFTLSVQTFFNAGGVAGGLTFGYQDSDNFWAIHLKNGAQASGGLNSDIFIRYRKAGANTTLVDETSLANVTLSTNSPYTLTVRYAAATTNLSFEVLDPNGVLYYTNSITLDTSVDLPMAAGSLFGIQSFTSGASGYENFWGSLLPLNPAATIVITSFQHNPALGQSIVTWTSEASASYSLLGGSNVTSTNVLETGIAGQAGTTTTTNTQPVGTPTWFYRVMKN
jgi:hypothetical protein